MPAPPWVPGGGAETFPTPRQHAFFSANPVAVGLIRHSARQSPFRLTSSNEIRSWSPGDDPTLCAGWIVKARLRWASRVFLPPKTVGSGTGSEQSYTDLSIVMTCEERELPAALGKRDWCVRSGSQR